MKRDPVFRNYIAGAYWWCYQRTGDPAYALRAAQALREVGLQPTPKEWESVLEALERAQQPGEPGPKSPRAERDYHILQLIRSLKHVFPERSFNETFAHVAKLFEMDRGTSRTSRRQRSA